MIAFDQVRVRYPANDRDALAGVSFTASPGQLTAVVGPNGSGKSTLVRALLGRIPLQQGRVTVDGTATALLSRRDLARRVAVVSQREEPAFPLSVRDYVALGRFPWQHAWSPPSPQDLDAAERALREADVVPLADRRTDALSGGEWQRVRVARALAQATDAIVLDEIDVFDIARQPRFELLAALAHRSLRRRHQSPTRLRAPADSFSSPDTLLPRDQANARLRVATRGLA
jgi:iron complex transport system ATP-binding protein